MNFTRSYFSVSLLLALLATMKFGFAQTGADLASSYMQRAHQAILANDAEGALTLLAQTERILGGPTASTLHLKVLALNNSCGQTGNRCDELNSTLPTFFSIADRKTLSSAKYQEVEEIARNNANRAAEAERSYQQAIGTNTLASLEKYLAEYPSSKHSSIVRSRVNDLRASRQLVLKQKYEEQLKEKDSRAMKIFWIWEYRVERQ